MHISYEIPVKYLMRVQDSNSDSRTSIISDLKREQYACVWRGLMVTCY